MNNKIKEFTDYLFNTTELTTHSVILAENRILTGIAKNIREIEQTLMNIFPDIPPRESLQLILQEIKLKVLESISPFLMEYINTKIDFTVLEKIDNTNSMNTKQLFLSFVNKIIQLREVRYKFNSTINIFQYNVLERYIPEIFKRRSFIYNELIRTTRININADEYINYLKCLLLIRPSGYIPIPIGEKKLNIGNLKQNPKLIGRYIEKLKEILKKSLNLNSPKVVDMSIKSNLPESMTKPDEGPARFLYVLCERFQEFIPYKKIERGAETPDKSWFSIARKNAKYYGYDVNIIDELYRIAGENNW